MPTSKNCNFNSSSYLGPKFTNFFKTLLAVCFFSIAVSSAATENSQSTSLNKAQLELTHFLFTQVFESYFEEGDRFVVESLDGNSDRAYLYFMEKKFFTAFLKQWERTIDQYGTDYPSTLVIFKNLLNEPGFLHDNAYLLKLSFGINDSFLEYGHFRTPVIPNLVSPNKTLNETLDKILGKILGNSLSKTPDKTKTNNNNFRYPQDAIALGLSPYLPKPTELGYARIPFLLHVLDSEKNKDPEQRSLQILDDVSRMIAYERNDRKTYFWIAAFFLNNPSEKVSLTAEKILKNLGTNEIVDILADSRWFFIGGRGLWALREQFMLGLKAFGQTAMAQSFHKWLNSKWSKLAIGSEALKKKANLAALSTYRAIKALSPIQRSAVLSTSGHLALISYFAAVDNDHDQETTEDLRITEALKIFETATLSPITPLSTKSSDTFKSSETSSILWQEFHPSIKNYITESPYAKLRSYDTTPLSLLNQIKLTQLLGPQELILAIDKRLSSNRNHDNFTYDYGSLFTQDEYYRAFANTNSRDLRLLSMADAINLERRENITEILHTQVKRKVEYFNQLTYDDFRLALFSSLELMRAKHTYYYSRDSRSLIREMIGEGGNCVAIAMLQLSLLSPLWGDGEWKLGIVFEPNHVRIIAFSEQRDSLIQLDNLSEKKLTSYKYSIYHPDLFLAAIKGPILATDYLLSITGSKYNTVQKQNVDVEKALGSFGFDFSKISSKIEDVGNSNIWTAKIKNLINNPITNIKFPKILDNNDSSISKIPEFAVTEQLGDGDSEISNFNSWKMGLNSILDNILKNHSTNGPTEGLWYELAHNFYYCSIERRYLNHPDFRSEDLTNLIPLLNGTLGYFMISGASYSASDGYNCKFNFYLNKQQQDTMDKLDIENLLKIMLLSLTEQGKALSAEINQKMSGQMSAFFDRAKNLTNAGSVIKDSSIPSINNMLFSLVVFRETVAGIDALVKAINPNLTGDSNLNHLSRSINAVFEEYKRNISYPKKVLGFSESQNLLLYEEAEGISGAIIDYTLLKSAFSGHGNPYKIFNFQISLLVNQKLGLCVDKPQSPDSNEFFVYTFYRYVLPTQGAIQELFPMQYNPLDLTTDIKFCEKNTLNDGYLQLLTTKPQLLRANFLLANAPANFAPTKAGTVQVSAWKTLNLQADDWELEIPTIQRQACTPKKTRLAVNVDLPELPKALCKGKHKLMANSMSLVCFPSVTRNQIEINNAKNRDKNLNLPECSDAILENNFSVQYSTDSLSNKLNTSGKVKIPFENILALYSIYNSEHEVSILSSLSIGNIISSGTSSNSGPMPNSNSSSSGGAGIGSSNSSGGGGCRPGNIRRGCIKLRLSVHSKPMSLEEIRADMLSQTNHFSIEVAQHIVQHKEYYLNYWDVEFRNLCSDIANLTTPFAEALRKEGLCTSQKTTGKSPSPSFQN